MNNELIAIFMNLDRHPNNERAYWIEEYSCYLTFDNLRYHNSWNQLMDVVEKINGLEFTVMILGCRCEISLPDRNIISDNETSIKTVYNAVVEFIQWYNTTKQPQPEPDHGSQDAKPSEL